MDLHFKIKPELHERLKHLSEAMGISISTVVRLAINEYLEKKE